MAADTSGVDCEEMAERLIDLLEGELPADEHQRAAEHIRRCPCCAAMKSSFQGVRDLVRRSMEEPLSETQRADLARAVLDALAAEGARAAAPPARS